MPIAVARGHSMQPLVNEGDILIFQGVLPEELQVGDIIFFEVPLEMRDILPERITHRIIEVKQDPGGIYFRTQGDNAPPDTYEVRSDSILGKNIAIIPYVGILFIYIQTPIGIGLIVALLVISEFRRDR